MLAGAGEKEEEGVLYFISGQRDYLQSEDAVGLLGFGLGGAWRVVKRLGSVLCVVVAILCMPVYCAFWPEWVLKRQSNREVPGRQ